MTAIHPRADRAVELLDDIFAAFEQANVPDLDKITFTLDLADAHKVASQRVGVVVLEPGPQITYPAPGISRVMWEVKLITSATIGLVDAWKRLDNMLRAIELSPDFDLERAQSGQLLGSTQGQTPLRAYIVHLAETNQY
jgi:hypothetical protein